MAFGEKGPQLEKLDGRFSEGRSWKTKIARKDEGKDEELQGAKFRQ